jgi:hypothetical protein
MSENIPAVFTHKKRNGEQMVKVSNFSQVTTYHGTQNCDWATATMHWHEPESALALKRWLNINGGEFHRDAIYDEGN